MDYVPLQSQLLLLNLVLKILLVSGLAITISLSEPVISKRGCSGRCGSVRIPYPFGTSLRCSHNKSFLIICKHTTTNSNPQPFFPHSNVSILNVLLSDGLLRVANPISHACYDSRTGNLTKSSNRVSYTITNSIFPLSITRNKFTTVGCNTIGLMQDNKTVEKYYRAACLALCNKTSDLINGTCSGLGRCQLPITKRIFNFGTATQLYFSSNVTNGTKNFNSPCSYAFVVEEDAYKFSSLDLVRLGKVDTLPLLLDWAVGDQSCTEAKRNKGYACRARKSECFDSTDGPGYRCKCSPGYHGNPYLLHGCQEIDECKHSQNPCTHNNATCINLAGNFTCLCPKGYNGDRRRCFPAYPRRN